MSDEVRERARAPIEIVFDGPPSHESGRFVEVEDGYGHSINFGEWAKRDDGYWVLRLHELARLEAELAEARAALESLHEECDRQLGVEVDRLRGEVTELNRLLTDALDLASEGWSYADNYFRRKSEVDDRMAEIDKARAALAAQPDAKEEPR